MPSQSITPLQRLHAAMNQHDLEAFVDCFASDYRSEQPTCPSRNFAGSDQVRKNWSAFFAAVPDFHADLLRSVAQDGTIWAEWHWTGTRPDGSRLDLRGVTLFGVHNHRLAWGRLYMEETEETAQDIDERMQELIRHS
jgi:ketosteroid isomerase-like protein